MHQAGNDCISDLRMLSIGPLLQAELHIHKIGRDVCSAQVAGDTGEATCRGALEAAGLVGSDKGQIPPQRLLFCSTLDGKASIVRQIEPSLHIDANAKTVCLSCQWCCHRRVASLPQKCSAISGAESADLGFEHKRH